MQSLRQFPLASIARLSWFWPHNVAHCKKNVNCLHCMPHGVVYLAPLRVGLSYANVQCVVKIGCVPNTRCQSAVIHFARMESCTQLPSASGSHCANLQDSSHTKTGHALTGSFTCSTARFMLMPVAGRVCCYAVVCSPTYS